MHNGVLVSVTVWVKQHKGVLVSVWVGLTALWGGLSSIRVCWYVG